MSKRYQTWYKLTRETAIFLLFKRFASSLMTFITGLIIKCPAAWKIRLYCTVTFVSICNWFRKLYKQKERYYSNVNKQHVRLSFYCYFVNLCVGYNASVNVFKRTYVTRYVFVNTNENYSYCNKNFIWPICIK